MHCINFNANNRMRFYACIIFDPIIRYQNTQRIQSERTVRSCLLINTGRSKHVNTRLGTRLYTVVILGTLNSAEKLALCTPLLSVERVFSNWLVPSMRASDLDGLSASQLFSKELPSRFSLQDGSLPCSNYNI